LRETDGDEENNNVRSLRVRKFVCPEEKEKERERESKTNSEMETEKDAGDRQEEGTGRRAEREGKREPDELYAVEVAPI